MRKKRTKTQIADMGEDLIIGSSPEAKRLKRAVRKLAKIDSNVLIIGETGTGKEFIARQIFSLSPRRNHQFVEVNCSALGKTISLKDLFGEEHPDGSTTIGLLEKANNGILFLDNIADMNYEFQDEFLQVLRDKKFKRLNGNEMINATMRIIATSDHDLTPEIESEKFRKELYYLVNMLTLQIPPLRERKQDIPELFTFFLRKYCQEEGREEPAVQSEIFESIMEYDWKGNIRELENTVKNLLLMSPEGELSAEFLPFRIKKHPFDFLEPRNLKAVISEIEIYLIKKALKRFGGNQVKAARLLGVPEATLRFKMKKYAIPKD
ncbi:MAG: sigma 54-interacting transcriptional regulator [candidate division KSB1 bacterium]|nr:sigma 54-interacting transcriptional regulator [candidate division KSB1 bacterium]MDZ7333809.1 sigma 54-interacting transcriptional regulator [candidate division KSB1 bacterium]MDZ7356052.1 sigma 54-interacting transcriptional regulator [candidate division KSB1 bacterium]MDZ7376441.1 sigma 54-interacting transcriptional regulator [candidate division KSB1 bacterium]MDZ7400569.1 sigma 54-interacting transcriptional regulator [candidate division KSB1 bacterium]